MSLNQINQGFKLDYDEEKDDFGLESEKLLGESNGEEKESIIKFQDVKDNEDKEEKDVNAGVVDPQKLKLLLCRDFKNIFKLDKTLLNMFPGGRFDKITMEGKPHCGWFTAPYRYKNKLYIGEGKSKGVAKNMAAVKIISAFREEMMPNRSFDDINVKFQDIESFIEHIKNPEDKMFLILMNKFSPNLEIKYETCQSGEEENYLARTTYEGKEYTSIHKTKHGAKIAVAQEIIDKCNLNKQANEAGQQITKNERPKKKLNTPKKKIKHEVTLANENGEPQKLNFTCKEYLAQKFKPIYTYEEIRRNHRVFFTATLSGVGDETFSCEGTSKNLSSRAVAEKACSILFKNVEFKTNNNKQNNVTSMQLLNENYPGEFCIRGYTEKNEIGKTIYKCDIVMSSQGVDKVFTEQHENGVKLARKLCATKVIDVLKKNGDLERRIKYFAEKRLSSRLSSSVKISEKNHEDEKKDNGDSSNKSENVISGCFRDRVYAECGLDATFTLLGIGTDDNHRVRLVADGQSFIGDGEDEHKAGEDAAKKCLQALTGFCQENDDDASNPASRSIVFNRPTSISKNPLKRKPAANPTSKAGAQAINVKKAKQATGTAKANNTTSRLGVARGTLTSNRGVRGNKVYGRNRVNASRGIRNNYNNNNTSSRNNAPILPKPSIKQRLGRGRLINNVAREGNPPMNRSINPNMLSVNYGHNANTQEASNLNNNLTRNNYPIQGQNAQPDYMTSNSCAPQQQQHASQNQYGNQERQQPATQYQHGPQGNALQYQYGNLQDQSAPQYQYRIQHEQTQQQQQQQCNAQQGGYQQYQQNSQSAQPSNDSYVKRGNNIYLNNSYSESQPGFSNNAYQYNNNNTANSNDDVSQRISNNMLQNAGYQ